MFTRKVLSQKFFERPAPVVAADLIGKYLMIRRGSKTESHMITETEAYEGAQDLASHASGGRTKRNEVMFGKAGVFYVYLVYGMYEMLNITTGKKDHPAAVLIRGVKGALGPGKLTKTLGIGREFNGKKAKTSTKLWFGDKGEKVNRWEIKKASRVGVNYAGPIWSKKHWRFIYKKWYN